MPHLEQTLNNIFKGIVPVLKQEIDRGIVERVKNNILSKRDLFIEAASIVNFDELFYLINTQDNFTAEHSERVAELCEKITSDNRFGTSLYYPALFHDIGKLFIDALHKNGDLEHKNFIKFGHSLAGFVLCDYRKEIGNKFPSHVENAIKHHHVNGNGDSYPVNYKVHDAVSRIVQFADIIDAMKNRGGYQKRYSDDEIAKILIEKGYPKCAVESVLK